MKNDTTFVCRRSIDHLGDAKMSKKGTLLRRIAISENGFRRMKEEGQISKILFSPELSYDLSKFSNDFTPFFDFERP